ncbi:hypothetical protein Vadar_007611 [Vaccinium darrowii]|uniref:Uncharacterized protein n=1 Tax=Vaccinium darrowii TaxID=229202 RepID=A0ACB7ZHV4_9ERIC|nr:hypothetical protein Vadar_007611 [Vaccinium darrowii]
MVFNTMGWLSEMGSCVGGHKCSDFGLNRFDLVYTDLKLGIIDFGKPEYVVRCSINGKVMELYNFQRFNQQAVPGPTPARSEDEGILGKIEWRRCWREGIQGGESLGPARWNGGGNGVFVAKDDKAESTWLQFKRKGTGNGDR